MTTETTKRRRGRPRDPRATPAILQATRELVAELGVDGASMSAIADRCGVGKPTIYLRFDNRRDVIRAALDGVLTDAALNDPNLLSAAAAARRAVLQLIEEHDHGRFLAEALVMPRAEVVMGDAEIFDVTGDLIDHLEV